MIKKISQGGLQMSKFETAIEIMAERFGKDSLIAIATTDGKRLYNRMVDAYYENGAFYVSTYALSNKMKQIEANPEAAVCAVDWFSGHGVGKNLGWVMKPENAEMRLKLRKTFEWYDHANNEKDENSCILKISLTDGMLIKDHHALRYQIDFVNKAALLSENWGEFK
jgi:general stress protein 26